MPNGTRSNPGPLSRAVAAILEAERQAQGLSQTELGAAVGLSQSQMSKLLRAERAFLVDHLDAVCTTLGLDIVDVVRTASAP